MVGHVSTNLTKYEFDAHGKLIEKNDSSFFLKKKKLYYLFPHYH